MGGQPLLVIGLSAENCRRLLLGQPIPFDTAPLGLPPMRVLICGGQTEEAIAADLRKHWPATMAAVPGLGGEPS